MMQQFLNDLWKSPKEEFLWFLSVMWWQFVYVAITLLILYWMYVKIRGPKK